MPRFLMLASVAVALATSHAHAQAVRLVTPDATLAEEFSQIRGVRELADRLGLDVSQLAPAA